MNKYNYYEEDYNQEQEQQYDNRNIFQRIPKAAYIAIGIVAIILIIFIKGIFFHTCPNGYDTPDEALMGFKAAYEAHDIEGLKNAIFPSELLDPEIEWYLVNTYNYSNEYNTNFTTLDQVLEYEFYVRYSKNSNNNYAMNIASYEYHETDDRVFTSNSTSKEIYRVYGVNAPISQVSEIRLHFGKGTTIATNASYLLDKYYNTQYDENGNGIIDYFYMYTYNVNGKWYIDDRFLVGYFPILIPR